MADAAVLSRHKGPPPFGRNEPARSSNVVGHESDMTLTSGGRRLHGSLTIGQRVDAGMRTGRGYCSYRPPENIHSRRYALQRKRGASLDFNERSSSRSVKR